MKKLDWFVLIWLALALCLLGNDILYNSNYFAGYMLGSFVIELLNLFGYDD